MTSEWGLKGENISVNITSEVKLRDGGLFSHSVKYVIPGSSLVDFGLTFCDFG